MQVVQYKKHPIFSHLIIGSNGEIFSTISGKFLKQNTNSGGYRQIGVFGKTKMVHRLIAETYLKSSKNLTVNHKNGIKSDNSVENLEYISIKKNIQHAFDEGLISHKGEKNARHILKEVDVVKILSLKKEGQKNKDIFKLFPGISKRTIEGVIYRLTWSHVIV